MGDDPQTQWLRRLRYWCREWHAGLQVHRALAWIGANSGRLSGAHVRSARSSAVRCLRRLGHRAIMRHRLPAYAERIISGRGTRYDEGGQASPRNVYYLKSDMWLVRPGYALWFIRRLQGARVGLPLEYVKATSYSSAYTRRFPIIRLKAATSKLSLFDIERRVKRTVWADADAHDAAIAAVKHFSRAPASVPPVITHEPDSLSMEEVLVGPFLQSTGVRLSHAVPILLELNASGDTDVMPLQQYVRDNLTPVDRAGLHLDDVSRARLAAIFETIVREAQQHPERTVPMTQAHNDLSVGNMVRDGGRVYFLDLDNSFRATLWYDLVYLKFKSDDTGFDELARSIIELNARVRYAEVAPADSLRWSLSLFAVDFCRYVSSRILKNNGPPALRRARRPPYRLRMLAEILRNEVWTTFDQRLAGIASPDR
jgi:hypothetical protein